MLIFSLHNIKVWVAKSEIVMPTALHQWYIYGAKFKDSIRLLFDEQRFLNKFLVEYVMHICQVIKYLQNSFIKSWFYTLLMSRGSFEKSCLSKTFLDGLLSGNRVN